MIERNIYNIKLHEKIVISSEYEILRVPGGWIYTFLAENGTGGFDMSSCFVPKSDEFKSIGDDNKSEDNAG